MKTALTGLLTLLLTTTMFTLEASAAEHPFQVCCAPYGKDNWVAIRIDTTTGRAWLMQGTNWSPIGGDEPSGPGPYRVQIISSSLPDQGIWYCMRTNLGTGHTWRMDGGKWVAMQDVAAP